MNLGMHRRALLQAAAAIAALPMIPSALSATAGQVTRRVRPSDAAWPSLQSWEKLKGAVGGNLAPVHSLFAPCQNDPQGESCIEIGKNLRNPVYIGDQPGGTQVSGWLDAWTPAPSAYVVGARSTADVVAAVNFARDYNLRLVVKGAGHSYQGTSNAPDSLLVWTRAMNKVTVHDGFVPQGCDVTPTPAVSAQSGAVWIDLYHAVTTDAGRYVQGGGCTDVGVAGLVQSGGFGSFSKGFGSAASSLLEAEVVTADGQVRICNARNNPDLFWALKGGGGGSWGVVTRLTLRTHELPQEFGAAWGEVKANSDAAFKALIARFMRHYADSLLNPHWGEQVSFAPDNSFKISMVWQGLSKEQAAAAWKPFADWLASLPHDYAITDALGTHVELAREWWNVDNRYLLGDPRPHVPAYHGWWKGDQDQVGAFIHGCDSLWLPETLLRRQTLLVEALFAASRFKKVQLHMNKGLAGAPHAALASTRDTAPNPAVLDAFALAIIADGEASANSGEPTAAIDVEGAHKDARAIVRAAAELHRIVPHAGSYVSESNYFNSDWQQAFWAGNHARLRGIKDRYDPNGLFFVHHGIGSARWSADGFTKLA